MGGDRRGRALGSVTASVPSWASRKDPPEGPHLQTHASSSGGDELPLSLDTPCQDCQTSGGVGAKAGAPQGLGCVLGPELGLQGLILPLSVHAGVP